VGRPNFHPRQTTRLCAAMWPAVTVLGRALSTSLMPSVCCTSSTRVESAKTRSMGAAMVMDSMTGSRMKSRIG
jgi:hypothetical protein